MLQWLQRGVGRKACVNLSPPGYGMKIKRMHVFIPEHKAGALKSHQLYFEFIWDSASNSAHRCSLRPWCFACSQCQQCRDSREELVTAYIADIRFATDAKPSPPTSPHPFFFFFFRPACQNWSFKAQVRHAGIIIRLCSCWNRRCPNSLYRAPSSGLHLS